MQRRTSPKLRRIIADAFVSLKLTSKVSDAMPTNSFLPITIGDARRNFGEALPKHSRGLTCLADVLELFQPFIYMINQSILFINCYWCWSIVLKEGLLHNFCAH